MGGARAEFFFFTLSDWPRRLSIIRRQDGVVALFPKRSPCAGHVTSPISTHGAPLVMRKDGKSEVRHFLPSAARISV